MFTRELYPHPHPRPLHASRDPRHLDILAGTDKMTNARPIPPGGGGGDGTLDCLSH